jgi:hypothetical protein
MGVNKKNSVFENVYDRSKTGRLGSVRKLKVFSARSTKRDKMFP